VKERPCWRLSVRQGRSGVFRDARSGKDVARGTCGGIKAWTQTVDDNDGYLLGNFAPLLPAMETPQIICPHDPDKSDTGAACQQPRYRIVGVSRLNDSFETRDIDTRVMRKGAGSSDSPAQRREPVRVLKRVSGCDQPPDAIKLESLKRKQGCAEMRLMRWIERSTK
jgi:hypothetical protein